MELSELDLDLVSDMRRYGVLTDAVRIEGCRRSVFVGCPDCDKLKDKMMSHGTIIGQKLHPVAALHGGGVAFHPKSPLNGPVPFPWEWFCYKIEEALRLKHTDCVSWYEHAACAAVYGQGLNIAQATELSLANRGYFVEYMQRQYRPGIQVPAYVHVDYHGARNDKTRRTYPIDIPAWLEFRDRVRDYFIDLPYTMPLVPAMA